MSIGFVKLIKKIFLNIYLKKVNSWSTGIKEESSYNQLKYFNRVVNSHEDVSQTWYLKMDSYEMPIFINYWISKIMKDLGFLNLKNY